MRALLTFFQNVHRVTNTAAMIGGTASAALAQVGVITPPSLAATVEQQQQQSASPQITGMRSTDSSQSLTGSVFATAASASASPVMLHHRRLSVASQTGGMSPSPAVGRRRDYAIAFLEEVIRREVANARMFYAYL